jgi:uncharacterized protein
MENKQASAPVSGGQRIAALDVVRGFALLGILIMNIQSFAMISAAYFNPTAYGDLTGVNYLVWLFSHVLADQKFMTLFAMLFGAGIVLMAQRAEANGVRPGPLHYRRMIILIVFGLLHGHLLFYGDILYTYGMTALVVYLAWRRSARTQILLGMCLLSVGASLFFITGLTIPHWPAEALAVLEGQWLPAIEAVEQELAAYRGSYFEQTQERSIYALYFETDVFLSWGFWRSGGLMLIGMACFKLGLFQLERPERFIRWALAAGLGLGLPLIPIGVYQNTAHGWSAEYSQWFGVLFNYVGSIPVSFAWIALVLYCMALPRWQGLSARLAAVGQTALSNYVLQSLICWWVFSGTGLGLFGSVARWQQLLIVLAVWGVQLWISPWWLQRYRYGPLEWLWRSLTYWRLQPLKR